MSSALLVVLLLAQAPDAPLVAPRPAVVLKAGDPLPWDGVCLDDAQAIVQANKVANTEGKVSPIVVVVAIAAGVVATGAAAAIGYVAGQKSR